MGLGGGGLEGLTSGAGGGAGGGSAVKGLGVWRYRTETTAPPASGQLRFNNVDIESATVLFLHETNADGTDMANFLEQLGLGAFLYIQDRTDATNFILVQISSNTDNGVYRSFGIDLVELQGVAPSQNSEVAVIATGDPSPAGSLPEFQYDADNLLLPAGADWLETTPAGGPVADTNNGAIRVLLLNDSVREGFGWQHIIPDGATSFEFDILSRAETAPPAARTIGTQLAVRQVPPNAIVQTPFAQLGTVDIDIPANEFFQYDSYAFTLAFFGLTAGQLTQWQFMRDTFGGGTNLTGDWAVAQVRHKYS